MHTLGALLLAIAAGGCFPTRTEDFQCLTDVDCTSDRTCTTGYCLPKPPDASVTPMIDAPPASEACEEDWPGETTLFDPCDISDPGDEAINLNTPGQYTINTTPGALSFSGPGGPVPATIADFQGTYALVSLQSLSITNGVTLRVTGTRPLIIASWTTIDVNGTIDASGGTTAAPGAGSILAGTGPCTNPTQPQIDQNNNDGEGGGAGGSFQTIGGIGGNGGAGNGNGGAGGTPASVRPGQDLAGGCGGQNGASANGNGAGVGGIGGGAVWLTAKNAITIGTGGIITAAGTGGTGATSGRASGGGGGSGGMIGLEAPTVSNAGKVAANGGGGGQGKDQNNGQNGASGTNDTAAAGGGGRAQQAQNGGGYGGDGGALIAPLAGNPGDNNRGGDQGGGGGGGGGAGYVIVASSGAIAGAGTVSPAVTPRQPPR